MDDVCNQVGPSCRIVAYDRPPFGLSSRPLKWRKEEANPYTLEAAADSCIGLMDALGIRR